ncbi:MAG TPA: ribosome small subunit-dependent GTPase A [Candidatus Paceibacterota bacterium]|nr:ribosome small subunit-dependent GTPase A [Verrucomicrobiota bacterium]HRY47679.1 ribosome small subunit-dependent GTPase A [Candidatus Paceibacterota bacterium]HSA01318.1 ribosome small subunit-dependent GTPase A [Candidatus Paceibacterota bacterium]
MTSNSQAHPPNLLSEVGWNEVLARRCQKDLQKGLVPGRVTGEEKHFYRVLTAQGEYIAQISGKFLHGSGALTDLPKVGDWVAVQLLLSEQKVLIHRALERRTCLSRRVPGRELEEQVLASNVDTAFVVFSLDAPVVTYLLQRYLVMVLEGGIRPIVVLNKSDLCDCVEDVIRETREVCGEVPLVAVSAETGEGLRNLRSSIGPGDTVVFIGASGVGKSTLINRLYGREVQATTEVRASDAKGRHTTTWRELILLPGGGCVIDTPGLREFQVWLADEGMRRTFPEIVALLGNCQFRDCSHTVEKGCAILKAVGENRISPIRYKNYIQLSQEQRFLELARQRPDLARRRRANQLSPHKARRGGRRA